MSFPEPILNYAEASKYSLESYSPEGLSGPAQDQEIDEMNLLAVASVHGHPQGEILQAFHTCFKALGRWFVAESWFNDVLTHNVGFVNCPTLDFTDCKYRDGQKNI